MVGAEFARATYLTEYVKPTESDKILNFGCGPANILNHIPAVN
jgi:hypothetical protein